MKWSTCMGDWTALLVILRWSSMDDDPWWPGLGGTLAPLVYWSNLLQNFWTPYYYSGEGLVWLAWVSGLARAGGPRLFSPSTVQVQQLIGEQFLWKWSLNWHFLLCFRLQLCVLLDLVTALTYILTVLGEQVWQGGKLELQDSPGPAADRLQLCVLLDLGTALTFSHPHPPSEFAWECMLEVTTTLQFAQPSILPSATRGL